MKCLDGPECGRRSGACPHCLQRRLTGWYEQQSQKLNLDVMAHQTVDHLENHRHDRIRQLATLFKHPHDYFFNSLPSSSTHTTAKRFRGKRWGRRVFMHTPYSIRGWRAHMAVCHSVTTTTTTTSNTTVAWHEEKKKEEEEEEEEENPSHTAVDSMTVDEEEEKEQRRIKTSSCSFPNCGLHLRDPIHGARMRRHLCLEHLGRPLYPCTGCTFTAHSYAVLRAHVRRHHLSVDQHRAANLRIHAIMDTLTGDRYYPLPASSAMYRAARRRKILEEALRDVTVAT